jgi:hypothetical protein
MERQFLFLLAKCLRGTFRVDLAPQRQANLGVTLRATFAVLPERFPRATSSVRALHDSLPQRLLLATETEDEFALGTCICFYDQF